MYVITYMHACTHIYVKNKDLEDSSCVNVITLSICDHHCLKLS